MEHDFEVNEISVYEIIKELWSKKLLIISITTIFSIASVAYALSINNIYKSDTIVSLTTESRGSDMSQYQGLAAMAGINLPTSQKEDKSKLAIANMKSREFFDLLMQEQDFLINLMAAESFDHSSKKIIFDSEVYNIENNSWIREYSFPQLQVPSLQEAHKYFLDEIFNISQDKESKFITISISHISPVFAKETLDIIIKNINETSRRKDLSESDIAMRYLELQLTKTNILNISDSINELIEFHTYRQMKAQTNEDYLLKVIDKPYIPEYKSGPQRALICILGFILGILTLSIYILISSGIKKTEA
jgi:uncharacterized protein involved in exopolysaccharide biosynthesis